MVISAMQIRASADTSFDLFYWNLNPWIIIDSVRFKPRISDCWCNNIIIAFIEYAFIKWLNYKTLFHFFTLLPIYC